MSTILEEIKSKDTQELYRLALETQVKVCSEDTISYLRNLSGFQNAQRILDAGCGPGALVNEIYDLVQNKSYLGVDKDTYFIEQANAKFEGRSLNFSVEDVNEFNKGQYDIIFMYAILQHLPDIEKALDNLRKRLSPGGKFVIYDTKDGGSEITSTPELPLLTNMYSELQKVGDTRNISCVLEAEAWAKKHGLVISDQKDMDVQLVDLEYQQCFIHYSIYASEMLKRFYEIDTDQEALLAQLEQWRDADNSSVRLTGGRWIVISGS